MGHSLVAKGLLNESMNHVTQGWTLTGKSGFVSCGATSPFFLVLVWTGFCLFK